MTENIIKKAPANANSIGMPTLNIIKDNKVSILCLIPSKSPYRKTLEKLVMDNKDLFL